MIYRDGTRLILELPDETKAEALEWLLTSLFSTSTPEPASELHRSVRPTEAHLVQLEIERMAQRKERMSTEKLVETNQGPVYPWRSNR